ncbi:MAG: 50S ribosomal protein L9 [Alloprevotella sp.]|nr:50S ribosomal protein L9 [Alloprevotella sp.]
MQLILKENVQGLGYKDDVVNVKNGYGRNYLIPTGKAVIASKMALKALEEELKQRAHKLAKIKADAEALAEKLRGVKPIVIATKVSQSGTVYGSVNALHISEALKEQGFDVDRKIIVLKDAKEVGNFVATVRLHKEVAVEIPFSVVAENAEELEAAKAEEAAAVEEAPVAEPVAEEAPAAEEEVAE